MERLLTAQQHNQRGFMLTEVIVSIGIMGIILFGIMSMMDIVNLNGSRIGAAITRNDLVARIRMNATRIATIEASANMTNNLGADGITPDIDTPNNLVKFYTLKNCFPRLNSTTEGCSKAELEDARGNRMYLAEGTSTDPNRALAGEDVFYSLQGVRCSQTEAEIINQCPISAMTWFEPFCLNFTTVCSKAMSLTIRYKIALRAGYTGKTFIPPVEGEVYLPLSTGIQFKALLDQDSNDSYFTQHPTNSAGIYTVEKFYGLPDQGTKPSQLRFLVGIGNPSGLVSMKMQMRSLTGTSAFNLPETAIPTALLTKTWQDIPDPTDSTNPWTINLNGAGNNMSFDFGRQSTPQNYGTVNKGFKIGSATESDTNYRWTVDSTSGAAIAPVFKSGFYQFRVLATDTLNGTIESNNYITVRVIPRAEILPGANQPTSDQDRNCTSNKIINYQFIIADDEGLGTQTVTLDGVDVPFSSVSGTSGNITVPFDLSQDIGEVMNKNFVLNVTAKNTFTDKSINNYILPASSNITAIVLNQKAIMPDPSIEVSPTTLRLNTEGTVTLTHETGSCCTENPTVTWQFPNVTTTPMFSSANQTTTPVCTVDSTTNVRTCTTTNRIQAINSVATGPDNIRVTYNYPSNSYACTNSNVIDNSKFIEVLDLPGIRFYITESLWLNLPGAESYASLSTYVPKAYVRIDFDPEENVTVVIKDSAGNAIPGCAITFTAGTGTAPVDKACNIPAGYTGRLRIYKSSSNVMDVNDAQDPSFKAKLIANQVEHTTCQANITNIPGFTQNMAVTTAAAMTSSPWTGTDPLNDAGFWAVGDGPKKLRCYDNWSYPVSTTYTFNPGNDVYNRQDYYNLFKYNTEQRTSGQPFLHRYLGDYFEHSTAVPSGYRDRWVRTANYRFPGSDFSSLNAPTLFMVTQDGGTLSNANWRLVSSSNTASTTRAFTNYTAQACPGVAFGKVKLYGSKANGFSSSSGASMLAFNQTTVTVGSSGSFSYSFMCSYGRWNPSGKTLTTWQH